MVNNWTLELEWITCKNSALCKVFVKRYKKAKNAYICVLAKSSERVAGKW